MLRNQFRKQTKNTAKHLHLNYRALPATCATNAPIALFCPKGKPGNEKGTKPAAPPLGAEATKAAAPPLF